MSICFVICVSYMKKAITKIIEIMGTQAALANVIGLKPQSVSYMVKIGYISLNQMPRVAIAVKHRVSIEEMMADLPSKFLNPKKRKKNVTPKS